MTTKTCPACKIEKDITEYVKDKSRKNGISSYCKLCFNKYQSTKRRNQRFNGCCRNCNKPKLLVSKYCLNHWVKTLIKSYGLTAKQQTLLAKDLIAKLEFNEYSCFYTGLKLIPGFNASLDHRIPRTKGGGNTIDNLEWVHVSVNKIKFNQTEKEFLNKSAFVLVELNSLASKGAIL